MPIQHERIRVAGREGLFIVLSVDYKSQIPDLIGVFRKEMLTGISFESLFASFQDSAAKPERANKGP